MLSKRALGNRHSWMRGSPARFQDSRCSSFSCSMCYGTVPIVERYVFVKLHVRFGAILVFCRDLMEGTVFSISPLPATNCCLWRFVPLVDLNYLDPSGTDSSAQQLNFGGRWAHARLAEAVRHEFAGCGNDFQTPGAPVFVQT